MQEILSSFSTPPPLPLTSFLPPSLLPRSALHFLLTSLSESSSPFPRLPLSLPTWNPKSLLCGTSWDHVWENKFSKFSSSNAYTTKIDSSYIYKLDKLDSGYPGGILLYVCDIGLCAFLIEGRSLQVSCLRSYSAIPVTIECDPTLCTLWSIDQASVRNEFVAGATPECKEEDTRSVIASVIRQRRTWFTH